MRPFEAYQLIKHGAVMEDVQQHARATAAYFDAHKADMARNSLNNVAYGLMSNPRGAGGTSLLGGSMGGVIDGVLMRPIADAATSLVRRTARKFYGLHDEVHPRV
jgi:hypothetical protein